MLNNNEAMIKHKHQFEEKLDNILPKIMLVNIPFLLV